MSVDSILVAGTRAAAMVAAAINAIFGHFASLNLVSARNVRIMISEKSPESGDAFPQMRHVVATLH
jgi:hypothetical protein